MHVSPPRLMLLSVGAGQTPRTRFEEAPMRSTFTGRKRLRYAPAAPAAPSLTAAARFKPN